LLALLEAHHILHVSKVRINGAFIGRIRKDGQAFWKGG